MLPPFETLQRMPFFGGVRDDVLDFLLAHAATVRVAAGGYFFREGEEARSLFVLMSGSVAVLRDWQGHELQLHRLAAGDCFGEMALMDLFPRSASVRAEEDCDALELTPAQLLAVFERDAEQFALIQMNMGREVCRRLRAADDMLFKALMSAGQATAKPPGAPLT